MDFKITQKAFLKLQLKTATVTVKTIFKTTFFDPFQHSARSFTCLIRARRAKGIHDISVKKYLKLNAW